MSTSIKSTFAETAGPTVHERMADEVKVYAIAEVAGAPDLVIDFQQTPGGSLHRLAYAALTKDEATSVIRAIVREGVVGDWDRVSIAHVLLSGLSDDFAEVVEPERRALGRLLQKVADGEF